MARFPGWLKSSSQIFWISGKAGAGKTTLMKYLIANRKRLDDLQGPQGKDEHDNLLKGRPLNGRGLILASHFFDHEGEQLSKSSTGFLQSLVFQLLRARPQLFEIILPRYEEMKRTYSTVSWRLPDLEVAFKTMLRHAECGPVMFFIDAMDEATGSFDDLVELFKVSALISSSNARFCISSRPSADFSFQAADPKAQLRLDEHTTQDILQFINKSFEEISLRFKIDYGTLIRQISVKAENVFLWARLVVEDLLRAARRKETVERLQRRLVEMPVQLDTFYQRMLDQSSDYDRKEVLQILGIISSAIEPLSLGQVQDTLNHCQESDRTSIHGLRGQPSSHQKLDLDEDFAERIQSMCCGLIDVRKTMKRAEVKSMVVFSHHTVGEFLSTFQPTDLVPDSLGLKELGSFDLLKACVSCMAAVQPSGFLRMIGSDEQFCYHPTTAEDDASDSQLTWPAVESQSSWTKAELNVQVFEICPLLRYAASHWAQHASDVETETKAPYRSILNNLASINLRLFSAIMRCSDGYWDSIEGRHIITPPTLFEYAIIFGLTRYVEEELESSLTPDAEGAQALETRIDYGHLLYAAATGGNAAIAEALLVWGSKDDSSLPNALARAVYRGNIDVAAALYKHGATWDDPGIYLKGYPIQYQYTRSTFLAVRIGDQPKVLKASPWTVLSFTGRERSTNWWLNPQIYYRAFRTLNERALATPVDFRDSIAEWEPEFAIDDYAVKSGNSKA